MKHLALCLLSLGLGLPPLLAQSPDPDSTQQVWQLLEDARQQLRTRVEPRSLKQVQQALQLGLWEEAQTWLSELPRSLAVRYTQAYLAWIQNDFFRAESLVQEVLDQDSGYAPARLLRARLYVESWQLDQALEQCRAVLRSDRSAWEAYSLIGRIAILKKRYQEALLIAQLMTREAAHFADGWLLLAETQFWLRNMEAAESALGETLRRNPFSADARYYYGYAIWRRREVSQLPAMAEQWALALAIHPLHYLTHWHWGNGHTHLTFADYADPREREIRASLAPADSLLALAQIEAAFDKMRAVAQYYSGSVLPAMMRASSFYLMGPAQVTAPLDSSLRIFQEILAQKPNYGPAHNGLAAVIKKQRMPYLVMFDSLESVIENTQIGDSAAFFSVFGNLDYFPGSRVPKMVWAQLYSSVAYLPLLQTLNRTFVIPPLHVDLALAMKSPYFRGATTFDNRQWMDIRGVGSGATGIEYVERGAHLERNVTLHEYVHLFHGQVFSDAEMRAVRTRYYQAMAEGLTLDYYSANNEFEYLAQTFTAYFMPVKVHPLNHKSVNTRSDLQEKDPLMYAFIDSLVMRQNAFLQGDQQALAENWAEVYVQLARQARARHGFDSVQVLLEKALDWDSTYLPAYLTYAQAYLQTEQLSEAQALLVKAEALNPSYAPTQRAYATLTQQAFDLGEVSQAEAIRLQRQYYEASAALETDFALRAELFRELRGFYQDFALIDEAVESATRYSEKAPTISTYLRDQQDDAMAFAMWHKGKQGYAAEAKVFFKALLQRKPQHFGYLVQYVEVLASLGQADSALLQLQGATQLLEAAGIERPDLTLLRTHLLLSQGKKAAAQEQIEAILAKGNYRRMDRNLWIRVLAMAGELDEANELFARLDTPSLPYLAGDYWYTQGVLLAAKGDTSASNQALETCLKANLYHHEARLMLLDYWQAESDQDQLNRLAKKGLLLPLPPGPAIRKRLNAYLEEPIAEE